MPQNDDEMKMKLEKKKHITGSVTNFDYFLHGILFKMC